MGTSSAYGGPRGGTPLVPSWLSPEGEGNLAGPEPAASPPTDESPVNTTPSAPDRNVPPASPDRGRFTAARNSFSRFARSGGTDRASLGRSILHYISRSAGGPAGAGRRMGAARTAGARLLGFLSDAQARGLREALQALDLQRLAGRPIEEIFLGLADFICPNNGTIDEGIARDAFIETIADLADFGLRDLDALTSDQIQTVFELYATHAIEARLLNDIGTKAVTLPSDVRAVERVEGQLRDFVRRGVSDALYAASTALQALTPDRVLDFVNDVYEGAFGILRALGEAEAAA